MHYMKLMTRKSAPCMVPFATRCLLFCAREVCAPAFFGLEVEAARARALKGDVTCVKAPLIRCNFPVPSANGDECQQS